jgi:hypothetical protein
MGLQQDFVRFFTDDLDHFIAKNYTDFLVKKVRSGSVTIIPDPTWPQTAGSNRIRIHNTGIRKWETGEKDVKGKGGGVEKPFPSPHSNTCSLIPSSNTDDFVFGLPVPSYRHFSSVKKLIVKVTFDIYLIQMRLFFLGGGGRYCPKRDRTSE